MAHHQLRYALDVKARDGSKQFDSVATQRFVECWEAGCVDCLGSQIDFARGVGEGASIGARGIANLESTCKMKDESLDLSTLMCHVWLRDKVELDGGDTTVDHGEPNKTTHVRSGNRGAGHCVWIPEWGLARALERLQPEAARQRLGSDADTGAVV